ncbi:MAG: glycosyltransferase [Planctomycetales bacterium]|nr:glycosyltransferase [Planctomycetales bacterium]
MKRYPRYSETFIVNEVLAHESAGLPIEIFSIRPPVDTHFQDLISRVRASVHYLPGTSCKASDGWEVITEAAQRHAIIAERLSRLVEHKFADAVAAVSLADRALTSGITHFHAHFATSATDVAWIAHRLTDIPFTLTAHAKDIFHEDVDLSMLAKKLRAAKATITVSDFNVSYLREQIGHAADNVVRIYNGLNLEHFSFQTPLRREPLVLAVGRLVEKKGFDVLLDACSILAKRGLSFRTQIIGDGPLSSELQNQSSILGLDRQVQFIGPQPQNVVKNALREAAVFAAPCVEGSDGNRDGLPTVLLESMAIGTPCVSTPVTGIPEAIIDQATGLLVPQSDPTALADAIERLIRESELRVRIAARARQHVEEHFDIHRNTSVQRSLFQPTASRIENMTERLDHVAVA